LGKKIKKGHVEEREKQGMRKIKKRREEKRKVKNNKRNQTKRSE